MANNWKQNLIDLWGRLTATRAASLDATAAGRMQIKGTTIDLNQAAGTYDLLTGMDAYVVLLSLVIRMTNGAVGGAVTGITIQTDDNTPQVIIPAAQGVVANLTDEAQLSWAGEVLIAIGTKIRLTIVGGAAGVAKVCQVVAMYRAESAGGYLV